MERFSQWNYENKPYKIDLTPRANENSWVVESNFANECQ